MTWLKVALFVIFQLYIKGNELDQCLENQETYKPIKQISLDQIRTKQPGTHVKTRPAFDIYEYYFDGNSCKSKLQVTVS